MLRVVKKLQLLALAIMRHKGLGDAGLREIVLEDFVDKIKQKVKELVTRDMDEGSDANHMGIMVKYRKFAGLAGVLCFFIEM